MAAVLLCTAGSTIILRTSANMILPVIRAAAKATSIDEELNLTCMQG
jgi:hypothetical protein